MNVPIIKVQNLKKHYDIKGIFGTTGIVKAVDGLTFDLLPGETLAVVGESGCGKSTLAKVLMNIEKATAGEFEIDNKNGFVLTAKELQSHIQMIFQDPMGSLNPRKKAWQIISEPLLINSKLTKTKCRDRAIEMMAKVGLRVELVDRYPHMFSGGQRQRIGIARALINHPKILICDEPVSALDVSIQAQILNLLMDLQDNLGLSYIFISHDLSVVKHIADKILVMYLGKIVEFGNTHNVITEPKHPYTKALIQSTPEVGVRNLIEMTPLSGELPSPLNPPSGCHFHQRCPLATDRCKTEIPILTGKFGRQVSCYNI